MAKEKLHIIREIDLKNNCPECYSQDLKLTFYQKHVYGPFFYRVTGQATHRITCNKCGSFIYPAAWTPDIEGSIKYYEKLVRPEKTSMKFTPLFYGLMAVFLLLLLTLAYLAHEGIISF